MPGAPETCLCRTVRARNKAMNGMLHTRRRGVCLKKYAALGAFAVFGSSSFLHFFRTLPNRGVFGYPVF